MLALYIWNRYMTLLQIQLHEYYFVPNSCVFFGSLAMNTIFSCAHYAFLNSIFAPCPRKVCLDINIVI